MAVYCPPLGAEISIIMKCQLAPAETCPRYRVDLRSNGNHIVGPDYATGILIASYMPHRYLLGSVLQRSVPVQRE